MMETEQPGRVRWNLGQLMVWIALFAVVFAVFGLVASGLLWLVFTPIWLAPRSERLVRLYWVGVFFPWLICLFAVQSDTALDPFSRSLIFRDIGDGRLNGSGLLALILAFSSPFVFMALMLATMERISNPSRRNWGKFAEVYEIFIILPIWLMGSCVSYLSVYDRLFRWLLNLL